MHFEIGAIVRDRIRRPSLFVKRFGEIQMHQRLRGVERQRALPVR